MEKAECRRKETSVKDERRDSCGVRWNGARESIRPTLSLSGIFSLSRFSLRSNGSPGVVPDISFCVRGKELLLDPSFPPSCVSLFSTFYAVTISSPLPCRSHRLRSRTQLISLLSTYSPLPDPLLFLFRFFLSYVFLVFLLLSRSVARSGSRWSF